MLDNILTGKAETDFTNWLHINNRNYPHKLYEHYEVCISDDFDMLPKILQFTLIQEWLDSVGLNIVAFPTIGFEWKYRIYQFSKIKVHDDELQIMECEDRLAVLKAAIQKSNELYNNQFSENSFNKIIIAEEINLKTGESRSLSQDEIDEYNSNK